jgi:hypothetical protein
MPYNFGKYRKRFGKWITDTLQKYVEKTPNIIYWPTSAPVFLVGGLLLIPLFLMWLLERQENFIQSYIDWMDGEMSSLEDSPKIKGGMIVIMALLSLVPIVLYAGPSALVFWVRKKWFGYKPQEEGEIIVPTDEVDDLLNVALFEDNGPQRDGGYFRSSMGVDSKVKTHKLK